MTAPDKIWVDPEYIDCMGTLDMTRALPNDVEYARADLCHASPMDVREAARVLAQHVITNCGTEEDDWIYVLSAICARTGGTLSDAMNALIAALRAIAETGGGE